MIRGGARDHLAPTRAELPEASESSPKGRRPWANQLRLYIYIYIYIYSFVHTHIYIYIYIYIHIAVCGAAIPPRAPGSPLGREGPWQAQHDAGVLIEPYNKALALV